MCHPIPVPFANIKIQNAYVLFQNPGDIKTKIDDINKKALHNKQCVQPFLIKCRGEEPLPTYYLVIDKVRYKFSSAAKAFDILFKCYHIFHATYPPAAAHLYLLIQRCVYNIETKYDKVVPYIADLLSLVNC